MPDDFDEDGGTERRACTLAAVTLKRLERLAKLGTHGTSTSRVMATLIEMGVRDAIERGYLKIDDL